jgi:nucleoside-diphosphate-sugar epimerase
VTDRPRLAVTGVPGWLTHALLRSLRDDPPADGDAAATALVHRDVVVDERLRAEYPNVTAWLPFDLASPGDLRPLLEGAQTVVHAAGIIHVRKPSDWDRVNTDGTIALAAAAKAAGVKRFVFLSSNAAGGASASASEVLTEDVPARPLSRYGLSKLRAEDALHALHEPGRFEAVSLRPSMFYGPPVPQRHVDVYRRVKTGRMPLVGNGDYRRSVTHVDNLVQAVRLAMDKPQAAGQRYYVVDDEIATTRSIVEAMAEALGVVPRYIRLPALAGSLAYAADRALEAAGVYSAPVHLVGESNWHVAISSAKARRELGYAPARSLREGMREAVEWCVRTGKL